MNQHPESEYQEIDQQADQNLILFLKQYQPVAPPAAIDLEQRIMEITGQISGQITQSTPRLKLIWLLPLVVLLAGLGSWMIGDRSKMQPSFASLNTEEKQQIEATLVKGWLIASGEDLEEVNRIYSQTEESN